MTIYSKKAERRRAIRTLVDAAQYLVRQAKGDRSKDLELPDFLAYVVLIQAAYKLGYRGPLLRFDRMNP